MPPEGAAHLHAGDALDAGFLCQFPRGGHTGDGIVVRHSHDAETGPDRGPDRLFGRPAAVGGKRMDMQVDTSSHNSFPVLNGDIFLSA